MLAVVVHQAEEAEASYKVYVADACTHHQELEDMKVTVLRQIQELIRQSDQTLRTVSPPNPQWEFQKHFL